MRTSQLDGSLSPASLGQAVSGTALIAVLSAVLASRGGYQTSGTFLDGFVPTLTIGAITVAVGAVAALLDPEAPPRHHDRAQAGSGVSLMTRRRRSSAADQAFGKVPTLGGNGGLAEYRGRTDRIRGV